MVVAGGQAGGLGDLFAVYASVWFVFLKISIQLVKTGPSQGTTAAEETSVLGRAIELGELQGSFLH